MSKFPVDASKRRVIRTFQLLGFRIIREREHIVMVRENQDGTETPLVMPNANKIRDTESNLYSGGNL
jgi:hypothetical protein